MSMHVDKAGHNIMAGHIHLFVAATCFRTARVDNRHARVTHTDNLSNAVVFNNNIYRTLGRSAFAGNESTATQN